MATLEMNDCVISINTAVFQLLTVLSYSHDSFSDCWELFMLLIFRYHAVLTLTTFSLNNANLISTRELLIMSERNYFLTGKKIYSKIVILRQLFDFVISCKDYNLV